MIIGLSVLFQDDKIGLLVIPLAIAAIIYAELSVGEKNRIISRISVQPQSELSI